MLNADDLRTHLTRKPFAPFELHLIDGRIDRIDKPDLLALSRDARRLTYYTSDSRIVSLFLDQISSIQTI